MESRANHVLIGSFVLLGIIGIFAFVIWKAKIDVASQPNYFDIYFSDSVSGLPLGGDVRYRGIKIGTVADIAVKADDPSVVVVRIEVRGDMVLREGDAATLKLLGITGVTFVNIEGAIADAAPLGPTDSGQIPVLPSRQSEVDQLVQGAPELLRQGTLLATRLSELFDADNQDLVHRILADIEQLTSAVASSGETIRSVIDLVESSTEELATAAGAVREAAVRFDELLDQASGVLNVTTSTIADARATVGKVDQIVDNDVARLVADLRRAASSIDRLTTEATALLVDNKDSIEEFTGDGLAEFTRFVADARLLVAGMSRVAERLEAQGGRYFLNNNQSDFRAE
ncbi:MAG: MlaD family protein [Gammaproteobacteria bacterium]|nr:MlaD family protein [Gammaproteobacteria bacterium]